MRCSWVYLYQEFSDRRTYHQMKKELQWWMCHLPCGSFIIYRVCTMFQCLIQKTGNIALLDINVNEYGKNLLKILQDIH